MEDVALKVSLVQGAITWHNPESNYLNFDKQIAELNKDVQLIVLPEMWTTGYTMQAHKMYEHADHALQKMQKWAKQNQATVIGSIIVKDNENYYNRLYVVNSEGVQATYDKRHLFAFAGEDRFYSAGKEQLIYELGEWRIALNICYDLRFPVWTRNKGDYDILVFCANWPDQRITAWNTLLRARAIENQAYVLGVNCYGKDIWGNSYSGHSAIISPVGEDLETLAGQANNISSKLSMQKLKEVRTKFPFLKDRDSFRLES